MAVTMFRESMQAYERFHDRPVACVAFVYMIIVFSCVVMKEPLPFSSLKQTVDKYISDPASFRMLAYVARMFSSVLGLMITNQRFMLSLAVALTAYRYPFSFQNLVVMLVVFFFSFFSDLTDVGIIVLSQFIFLFLNTSGLTSLIWFVMVLVLFVIKLNRLIDVLDTVFSKEGQELLHLTKN